MDRRAYVIGRGGYDGAGEQLLTAPLVAPPALPWRRKPKGAPILHDDGEGLLVFWSRLPPLIEAIRWYDATAVLKGFTEGRLIGHRLAQRVDEAVPDLHVLGPEQRGGRIGQVWRAGIGTLTHRSGADGASLGYADNLLRPPPLPARCDPARGLALPALHLEPPRCRRSVGRARDGDQQRDPPAMGPDIRAGCRAKPQARATGSA